MENNIQPLKCSLKFRPPTLVVFYDDLNTKKKRRRSIPLREFTSTTDVSEYASKNLYGCDRHKHFVAKIKRQQMESMLERVKTALAAIKKPQTVTTPTTKSMKQSGSIPVTVTTTNSARLTPLPELNTTIDTSLTSLSGLPALSGLTPSKPIANGKPTTQHKLSFDIDELLNQSTAISLLQDDEEIADTTNNSLKGKKDSKKNGSRLTTTGTKRSDDIHSLLTSTPTSTSSTVANTNIPAMGETANTTTITASTTVDSKLASSLPSIKQSPISSLGPLTTQPESLQPITNMTDSDESYEDDFEEDIIPKRPPGTGNNDDYSLDKENLSELTEEIESASDSDDDLNLALDKPFLQASELLTNEDDIVTPENSQEDFNKMAVTDYNKRKAAMELDFKKKQVKPGDPGFVYDKEVKFGDPKMESGWDSENSTDSEF